MRQLLALLCLCLPGVVQAQADRVYLNARIWTGDSLRPSATALAVRGDRLLVVGSDAEARATADTRTVIVDLQGRRVVPGFNDAHWHFFALNRADLAESGSLAEVQRRVRAYAAANPDAPWITGDGWVYTDFPGRRLHRSLLDAAVADRPAVIFDRDQHAGLANTRALALAGITRDTPDPPAGRIVRDASGEPTGELLEDALGLVRRLVPPPSPAELARSLDTLGARAAAFGLTSLQNVTGSFSADALAALEAARDAGRLKQRFSVAVPLRHDPTPAVLDSLVALRTRVQGPLLRINGAKGFVDGTVDARTAVMLEPFTDGTNGVADWPADSLEDAVARYDRAGFQVLLHAIGDGAIRRALDAFAHAARVNGTSGRRHRVEHMEVPHPDDLPRFRTLGVIASTQALFATPDPSTLRNYVPALGPVRARRAMPFRSIDEAGAVQAFGSDYPVFSMNPLLGVYVAATRMTPDGKPHGGWNPAQRISVEAALRHFTRDAAYASGEETQKGTLTAGKLADFVVLSADILRIPAARVKDVRVLRTVMGGRETYVAP